jgi:hypothetical protein
MSAELVPLGIGLLVAVAAVVVITVIAGRITRPRGRRPVAQLPQGAEAALWSIIEPLPDPRNHLALTRDLSGEVRITDADRVEIAALFGSEKPEPEKPEPEKPEPERWTPEFAMPQRSAPQESAREPVSPTEPLRPASSLPGRVPPRAGGWSPTPPPSTPDPKDESYVIVLAERVSDNAPTARPEPTGDDRYEPGGADDRRELQPAHSSASSEPERQWKRLFDRSG